MKKRLANLLMLIIIGSFPFLLHYMFDMLVGTKIEYANYCAEIYTFIILTFAHNYLSNRKFHIFRVMCYANFFASTLVYITSFSIESKLIYFIILIVQALLNLILTIATTICEKGADSYSENIHENYSENRYERYLLERIDEKLNLIKSQKAEEVKEESNDTKDSEDLLNGSDILAEMLKNHIEIKEYFKISKNQSKLSFCFSIISSVVGIIVVIIAASGIIVFKNVEISIIAAASGAITEIISGVVLWIHNKSALQLNYYYDSLHENEKFLSAVNIADKLSEEKKEDMYIEIIRKQIDIQTKEKENDTSNKDRK